MSGMGDVASPREFAAVGIKHIYLHSTACAATLAHPQNDLSEVEADITRLGAVTGTSARAQELVADMERKTGAVRSAIADVAPDRRPT
nr:ABC transporter substrate-binding protein [Protofrankia coriariae]